MSSVLYTNLPKLEIVFHFKHPASGSPFSLLHWAAFSGQGLPGRRTKRGVNQDRTEPRPQPLSRRHCEWARLPTVASPKMPPGERGRGRNPSNPYSLSCGNPRPQGKHLPAILCVRSKSPQPAAAGAAAPVCRRGQGRSTWLCAADSAGILVRGLYKQAAQSRAMVGREMSWEPSHATCVKCVPAQGLQAAGRDGSGRGQRSLAVGQLRNASHQFIVGFLLRLLAGAASAIRGPWNQQESHRWWDDWLSGRGESSGGCLSWFWQGFWCCLPWHPPGLIDEVQIRSVDWEVAEWPGSKGWHEVPVPHDEASR